MNTKYINFQKEDGKLQAYDAVRRHCGLVILCNEVSVVFSGNDCLSWLQGQVTNDIRKLNTGQQIEFCFCSPTGQLEAICKAWKEHSSEGYTCWVLTDKSSVSTIVNRFEKFVIMEDVEMNISSGKWLSLIGPEAENYINIVTESIQKSKNLCDLKSIKTRRCGEIAFDIYLDQEIEDLIDPLKKALQVIDQDIYRLLILEAGEPCIGVDIESKTLPPELGKLFESRAISYEKGCYIGQEILHRIHSRGHTNRTWVGLKSKTPVSPGSILSADGKNNIGYVTSSGWSPILGEIAAGYLRNEFISEGKQIEIVNQERRIKAEVCEMPLMKGHLKV